MKISFQEVNSEISEKLDNFFPVKNCFIEVNPGQVLLPRKYKDIAEEILKLSVRNDDIWLISYPRTGSTWAQEMIWLLGNSLDFEGAKKIQQMRAPILELTALFSEDHHQWVANSIGNSVDCIKNLPSPRFIRSHLPISLLPLELNIKNPKIIYTSRNPKDLCISFYYYCKLVHGFSGSLEEFCELFIADKTPVGSFWNHALPFWKKRNDPNVLFLKYEDMRRNLSPLIKRCADFMNIKYDLDDNEMINLREHLKFEKMQTNPAVNLDPIINITEEFKTKNENNKFIRKGQIGDWKNYLSAELSQKFDDWIATNNSCDTGLDFDYE